MSILFTPADVFDIAIEIERNGAAFYRKAAANFADDAVRRELFELAAMEDTHEVTFAQMKRDLVRDESPAEWFDAESDAVMYVRSFAAGHVFDVTKDPSALVTDTTPLSEILRFALDRERDSVLFFLGMQGLMPAREGRNRIEHIIKQEMGHITTLIRRCDKL